MSAFHTHTHTHTDSLTNVLIAGLHHPFLSSDPPIPSFIFMYIVGLCLQWSCRRQHDILAIRFYMTVNPGIGNFPSRDYGIEKMTPGLNALAVGLQCTTNNSCLPCKRYLVRVLYVGTRMEKLCKIK